MLLGAKKSSCSPILTKEGYFTLPSLEYLKTCNPSQLQRIENFTIANEHGKIEFEGETDVSNINLDEAVHIFPNFVDVYPEHIYTKDLKPTEGTKLNKPACISLNNCYLKERSLTISQQQAIIERFTIQMGAQFVSYDHVNGTYVIKVPHFTRYGFKDSDEEGNSDDEEEDQKKTHEKKSEKLASGTVQSEKRIIQPDSSIANENSVANTQKFRNFTAKASTNDKFQSHKFAIDEKIELIESEASNDIQEIADTKNESQTMLQAPIISDEKTSIETHKPQNEIKYEQLKGIKHRIIPQSKKEKSIQDIERDLEDIENCYRWLTTTNQRAFQPHGKAGQDQTEIESKMAALNATFSESSKVTTKTNCPLHRSFRVGWTKDGFVLPSKKKQGTVEIHKIILHRDLYTRTSNPKKSFSEYEEKLRNLTSKVYEPLLREMAEASFVPQQPTTADKKINLAHIDSHAHKLTRPAFSKALANFAEIVSAGEYSSEELSIMQEDLEIFGLLNALFGNPDFDFEQYAIEARSMDESSRERVLKTVASFLEGTNYTEYSRKNALTKWIERKSRRV